MQPLDITPATDVPGIGAEIEINATCCAHTNKSCYFSSSQISEAAAVAIESGAQLYKYLQAGVPFRQRQSPLGGDQPSPDRHDERAAGRLAAGSWSLADFLVPLLRSYEDLESHRNKREEQPRQR